MRTLLMIGLLLASGMVQSGVSTDRVVGEVYDITSTADGLLVRVKDAQAINIMPTDCTNPNQFGWMLIPEANKAMISVALAMRAQGKREAAVYANLATNGVCLVVQYDPHD